MRFSGEAELHAAIATVQVSEAAKDGTVSVEDLTTVETTLASQIGETEARRAIVRSLGEVFDKLDVDAKTHVLERASTIEAHTDRLQSIVDEMLEGKQTLIDINGDGKLDVGDLVFHANDEGKITVERINKKLADRATVAAAIVDASYAMNDAGVGFELIKDHRVNDEFWKVGAGGVMTLKPGVKPSDAVRDIVENGDEYGFECATGLVATYYVAMLDLLGPADFDRVADDVRMGPWKMDNDMRRLLVTSNPNPGSTYDELGDHALEPGFYYYFKNWDVTDDARERGWQGENVIYLGDGKFYGHGIGLGDADLFIDKLASEMEEDGKTPSLLNLHAWIDTDILDLDTQPGQ